MLGLGKNERLEKAIEKREWDKVSKLIDKGAVPALETLQEAAAANDVDLYNFALLFKSGAEKTSEILDTAIAVKELEKAMFLIEAHVVPAEDTLAYAVQALTPAWVKVLIEAGAKPAPDMLRSAIYDKNINMAQTLVAGGAFSTRKMRDYAAKHLDKEWVKLLNDAKMPLDVAVHTRDREEAEALLAEGAVPDNKTIAYAVSHGLGSYWIGLLVKAGGTSVDEMLEVATFKQDPETGNALLNAGVIPSEKALAYAVEHKMTQWVQVFVARGGKPTAEMLEAATRNQDPESGNTLLNAGVAPSEKALAYAVENKMSNWVKVFIARGGKPTVAMMDTATYNRDAESGTALLKAGIVPSEKALDYVVQNKLDNGGWAKIFLTQGAKPTSGTLGAAMINKDTALVQMILAKGVVPDELTLRYANNSQYAEYRDMLQKAVNDNKAKTPTEAYNEAAAPPPLKTEEAPAEKVKPDEPKQKKPKLVLGKNENDTAAATPAAPRPKKIILSRPKNGA